jgi:hypothetical protein
MSLGPPLDKNGFEIFLYNIPILGYISYQILPPEYVLKLFSEKKIANISTSNCAREKKRERI